MRVGLFGGSFNPIHFGHLRAAEEDREALGLDLVYFIPASSPPHKTEGDLAPAEHRLRMTELATKGNRHFMVSDAEIRRAGRSYTIDTVRHFLATMRKPSTVHLLMGADQFADFGLWKDADEIARLCNIVVHRRSDRRGGGGAQPSIAAIKQFGYTESGEHYVHPGGTTLSFVDTTIFPISSTQIRYKIQRGESINYLLPGDVADYIQRHAIY
ncbi:MAG TPA: nicotinate (nicotinamide) nucleotide adenylyltransferase [Candidatus Binataceae bacterium]|nr:nicotinate (nicotinamide) nucleotide adenylyltransferase [Candidatus Binataceae bacterium]